MNALAELIALAKRGEAPCEPARDVVNMHCHTFFSFNAYGHSPTSLAWLAKKRGFAAVGIVDFDVLDAVDEFLAACDLARCEAVRASNARLHPGVRHARDQLAGRAGRLLSHGDRVHSRPGAARGRADAGRHASPRRATQPGDDRPHQRPPGAGHDLLPTRRPAADSRRQRHRAAHAAGLHPRRRTDVWRCSGAECCLLGRKAGRSAGPGHGHHRRLRQILEPGARQTDEAGRRGLCAARSGVLPNRG